MSNTKTQKKYKFNKNTYKPIIDTITQDKMKLLQIIKKVHKDLNEIKKKFNNKAKKSNLTLNDYYYLHDVRNFLLKNNKNVFSNYNESKQIGKNIKNILVNLKKNKKFNHLNTNKLLNKVKKHSTKKKKGSIFSLKKYENKNFSEFFASNYIKQKINKADKLNKTNLNKLSDGIIKIYNEIVSNINNNEKDDPSSVLNTNTITQNNNYSK